MVQRRHIEGEGERRAYWGEHWDTLDPNVVKLLGVREGKQHGIQAQSMLDDHILSFGDPRVDPHCLDARPLLKPSSCDEIILRAFSISVEGIYLSLSQGSSLKESLSKLSTKAIFRTSHAASQILHNLAFMC